MNYYPHHIGDYLRDTAHLTVLEDGTYRRMLDVYYASEKPLPLETHWVCRLVRAHTKEEQEAVDTVLLHYFEKYEDGWHNKRADEEIRRARKRIKAAKSNGRTGGRPKTQQQPTGLATNTNTDNPNESSPKAKSQKPKRVGNATRLPPEWAPSELLLAWASKERPDLDLANTVAKFRDYWAAKPGRDGMKADWDATFRNWVRDEKPGPRKAAVGETI